MSQMTRSATARSGPNMGKEFGISELTMERAYYQLRDQGVHRRPHQRMPEPNGGF
jgi:biotin operon repressor